MRAPTSITKQAHLSVAAKAALETAGREFREYVEKETGLPIHLNIACSTNTFERSIRTEDGSDATKWVKAGNVTEILRNAKRQFQKEKHLYRQSNRGL